jgi:hypothetical protein
MQLDTVFQKTELGAAEIQHRSLGLAQRERTLLIMIDGHRPLSQLLVATTDLQLALAQIQSLIHANLIRIADKASASTVTLAPLAPLSPEAFRLMKMKASRALENVLGLDAERLCLLLEACKTEEEFESRFEKTVEIVRQMRTPSAAAAFKEVALGT